jgi:FHA domain
MSFRRFVYWCALCGGWAALAGWAVGRRLAGDDPLGGAGIKGLCLGTLIALGLGVVDAVWVYSLRQVRQAAPRVLACVAVGSVGGLSGGVVGQLLYERHNLAVLLVLGWALTGLMVGVAVGAFDFVRFWVREEDVRGAVRKVLRGILGGLVGGLLGGFLYCGLRGAWGGVFPDRADLWSPSATGFVALGLCIGLAIGVAQVVLKQAWLRVEAGFRRGREMPLDRPELTIGRAESCDLGLFGDPTVERLHARIVRQGGRYLLADAGTAGGTYVNDVRVLQPVPLRSGDLIRLGNALVRFRERERRAK